MAARRRSDVVKTTIEVPDTLHRTLRVKAVLEDRSMNELVVEALRGYLQDFHLEPGMLAIERVAGETSAT